MPKAGEALERVTRLGPQDFANMGQAGRSSSQDRSERRHVGPSDRRRGCQRCFALR